MGGKPTKSATKRAYRPGSGHEQSPPQTVHPQTEQRPTQQPPVKSDVELGHVKAVLQQPHSEGVHTKSVVQKVQNISLEDDEFDAQPSPQAPEAKPTAPRAPAAWFTSQQGESLDEMMSRVRAVGEPKLLFGVCTTQGMFAEGPELAKRLGGKADRPVHLQVVSHALTSEWQPAELHLMAIFEPDTVCKQLVLDGGATPAEWKLDARTVEEAILAALAQQKMPRDPDVVLVTAPGEHMVQCRVGLSAAISEFVPVFGASSAADSAYCGIVGPSVLGLRQIGITLVWTPLQLFFTMNSGYFPSSWSGIATKVSAGGYRLAEIDGAPAADVYNRWTGYALGKEIDDATDVEAAATKYVLGKVPYYDEEGSPNFLLLQAKRIEGMGLVLDIPVNEGDEVVLALLHPQLSPAAQLKKSRHLFSGLCTRYKRMLGGLLLTSSAVIESTGGMHSDAVRSRYRDFCADLSQLMEKSRHPDLPNLTRSPTTGPGGSQTFCVGAIPLQLGQVCSGVSGCSTMMHTGMFIGAPAYNPDYGSEKPPPSGNVVFVFTDIEHSTDLWEWDPSILPEIQHTHDLLMRKSIRQHGGYEVKTEGDAFWIAFGTVHNAVMFALNAQDELAAAAWPPRLAQYKFTPTVRDGERVVFAGPRVRMGVAIGVDVQDFQDSTTQRQQYAGHSVVLSGMIGDCGNGGQIVITQQVWESGPGGGGLRSAIFRNFSAIAFCLPTSRACWCAVCPLCRSAAP